VASVGGRRGECRRGDRWVLELAARGAATGLSAGLVIGLDEAGIAYGVYRLFKKRKS